MKQMKLIFCIFLIGFTSFAQQNINLRGVHYYYNLPSIGSLVSNTAHRAMSIHEIGNKYFLSGVHNVPLPQAGMVVINKYTNTIDYDYLENETLWSWSEGGVLLPNKQFLLAYLPWGGPINELDDSLRTVIFDSVGISSKQKFHTLIRSKVNLTRVNNELSALNGIKRNSVNPYILLLKNNGTIADSISLPLGNVYANLPVHWGMATHTFSLNDKFVTIGYQQRNIGLSNNGGTQSPCIWLWNHDSLYYFKEIFENYSPHNSEIACDWIDDADSKNNVVAILTHRDNNCQNTEETFPVYLTFLDSNLNIQWSNKIGNLPYNRYSYDINPRVVIDTTSSTILVSGNVIDNLTFFYSFFIEKWSFSGQLIFRKHFTIGLPYSRDLCSMTICENGDFLFSGTGSPELNQFAFFTYRTGPDGYHPDGEYLGIAEVTATPTEIGIFPNPSDGIFQVSSLSEEPMLITMLDQQGKQVAVFELNELSSDNSFDLSDQAPGVYFAHISQGENQWVKKLVVR